MELDTFYELDYLEEVRISPDSKRIAYVQREPNESNDEWQYSVYTVPTTGSADPHLLSRVADVSSITWSPDGTSLAFIGVRGADRALGTKQSADEVFDAIPQVWAFDLVRGGGPVQLTNFSQGVSEFDWAPTGDRLVVAVQEQDTHSNDRAPHERADVIEVEALQHKSVGAGWLEGHSKCLYVVDTESGECTPIDEAYTNKHAASHRMQPSWGPHGDEIAFLADRSESADDSRTVDVHTTSPDGSKLTRVTENNSAVTDVAWSPNGKRLAFVAAESDDPYALSDVIITEPMQARDECSSVQNVTSGLNHPVASDVHWRDEETVLFPVGMEGQIQLAMSSVGSNTVTSLVKGFGPNQNLVSYDLGNASLALGVEDPEQGYEVYYTRQVDGSCIDGVKKRLNVNAEFEMQRQFPACKRVTYSSEDGTEVEGLLYHPKDWSRDEERPVIVSVHGGPASFAHPEVLFDHVYWVNNGYAVFCPNYRGSSSYGPAFTRAIHNDICTKECTDVIRGAEYLLEQGVADPDDIYATGFSYGATILSHVVAETELFTAAAVEHGIYDYRSAFGTNDTHVWLEDNLGYPWENRDAYAQASSVLKVDSIETPLLIVAGEEDWRCPPTQAEQLYVSLKKQDEETKLLIYQDTHHNAGTPCQTAHRIHSLTEWFENH